MVAIIISHINSISQPRIFQSLRGHHHMKEEGFDAYDQLKNMTQKQIKMNIFQILITVICFLMSGSARCRDGRITAGSPADRNIRQIILLVAQRVLGKKTTIKEVNKQRVGLTHPSAGCV